MIGDLLHQIIVSTEDLFYFYRRVFALQKLLRVHQLDLLQLLQLGVGVYDGLEA